MRWIRSEHNGNIKYTSIPFIQVEGFGETTDLGVLDSHCKYWIIVGKPDIKFKTAKEAMEAAERSNK